LNQLPGKVYEVTSDKEYNLFSKFHQFKSGYFKAHINDEDDSYLKDKLGEKIYHSGA